MKNIFQKQRTVDFFAIVLLAILCYFPIFLHLSSIPIRMYDEARLATNAYEVLRYGDWIVTTYRRIPEMWNTKPPLMVWMQALVSGMIGFSELSIRLPAAFCAILTCALLFIFCFRYLKKILLGFICVLILITTSGYITEHVVRTGDYDSMLTLLTTAYLLCYFIFLESEDERQGKYLLYFFITLTLAVLCKGVQALMFLPAVAIFTLYRKKLTVLLRQKNFYAGMGVFFVFGIGYYLLRESLNHGYIAAVWENEIGGRYLQALEGHHESFWYYFQDLINNHFNRWYPLVPGGLLIGFGHRDERIRNLTCFLLLCFVQYTITLSFGATKLSWYEAPLYPLLALLGGIFLYWIYELIRQQEGFSLGLNGSIVGLILLILAFIKPYWETVNSVSHYQEIPWTMKLYGIPYYLKHAINGNINVDGYKVIYPDWPSSIWVYEIILEEKKMHISVTKFEELKEGDKVLVNDRNTIGEIENKFNIEVLDTFNSVKVYNLLSVK